MLGDSLQQGVPPKVYEDAIPLAGYRVVKSWDGTKVTEIYLALIEHFDDTMPARMEQRLAVHLASQCRDEPTPTSPIRLLA